MDYYHGRETTDPDALVAEVDCTSEKALCTEFDVKGFPTLRWGVVSDMEARCHANARLAYAPN